MDSPIISHQWDITGISTQIHDNYMFILFICLINILYRSSQKKTIGMPTKQWIFPWINDLKTIRNQLNMINHGFSYHFNLINHGFSMDFPITSHPKCWKSPQTPGAPGHSKTCDASGAAGSSVAPGLSERRWPWEIVAARGQGSIKIIHGFKD